MKWFCIGLIALMHTSGAYCSGDGFCVGGRSAALGKASVASADVWSGFNNQAGVAWSEGFQTGIFVENRFLMKEICFEGLGISWSGRPGAFGLSLTYYGFTLFNEFKAGISYSRKFGKRFSAGVQINYLRIQIAEGYGSRGVISCEAGIMYRPDQHWTIGMQVCNPIPIKLTDQPDEILPIRFRFGAGYALSGKALILLEAEKDLLNPMMLRTGVEIRLARSVYGRIGMHTGPFAITGGIGLSLGRMGLNIATEYHMTLGFSPAISIEYSIMKQREATKKRLK
ncbi:MAG: hypothetical protein IH596_06005 [Bacteroidales bacterium]|nr:hypothetical protein [Bacteroidales bacterium]